MPSDEYSVGDGYKGRRKSSKSAKIRKVWLYILAFLFIAIPVVVGVLVWHFVSPECKTDEIEAVTSRPEETATASKIEIDDNVTPSEIEIDDNVTPSEIEIDNNVTPSEIEIDDNVTPPEIEIDDGVVTETPTVPIPVDPNIGKVWDHYRLPRDIIPSHYHLTLNPDFYEDNAWFRGTEMIELEVVKSTSLIILHIQDITVTDVAIVNVDRNEEIDIARNFTYIKHNYLVLEFSSSFENGTHLELSLDFEGPLGTNLGFYKSTYVSLNGVRSHVASTMFDPVNARMAFPCFDEPDFKAIFTVTLIHKPGYTALSNMPEKIQTPSADQPDMVVTQFDTSLKMSTYLLCVVICDFEYINTTTRYGVLIRAWGPSEVIPLLDYSMELAGAVLDYLVDYLNSSYPLPKQDLIFIPEFFYPGMENWGIITFAAKYILFDPKKASPKEKQVVATLISHEVVHNWFGDLVTMDWWSDLWLNEGFTSYFQHPAIDSYHPDWDMMTQFESIQFPLSMATVAMATDITSSSRPIIKHMETTAEYGAAFDNMVYSKGATIMRMLRHFVGDDNFQDALQKYIQQYSYANANTDDFWEVFSQIEGFSSIKTIMDTWTLQKRYPYVDVACDMVINGSTKCTANQNLFTPYMSDVDEEQVSQFNYTWFIPLDYITSNNSNSQPMVWMNRTATTFDVQVDLDDASTWIKFNPGQMGYYRVNYPNEIWRRFADILQNDAEALDDADRANLIDDAFSFAEAGIISWTTAINLTSYIHQEKSYLPWYTFIYKMQILAEHITNMEDYDLLKQYTISKAMPVMNNLGWDTINEHTDALLQEQIISMLCYLQQPECLSTARNLFRQWIDNKIEVNTNFRTTVYVYGMQEVGTLKDWDEIMERFQQETSPHERRRLVYALTQTRYTWRVTRLLDQAVHEALVEFQDVYVLLQQAISNPVDNGHVWKWIKNNWKILTDKFALDQPSFGRGSVFDILLPSFKTEAHLKEVETLFEQYPATGASLRHGEQILKSIRNNIAEMGDHDDGFEAFRDWLKDNTKQ